MLEFANAAASIVNNEKRGASGNAQVRGDFACAKRSVSQKK